jgi:hypothetical protein
MDPELQRMQVRTMSYRRPTGTVDANGDKTYAAAVSFVAHYEGMRQKGIDNSGNQLFFRPHLITTTLLQLDDLIFDQGANTSDLNQGKEPTSPIEEFLDPETGGLDHYQVTL